MSSQRHPKMNATDRGDVDPHSPFHIGSVAAAYEVKTLLSDDLEPMRVWTRKLTICSAMSKVHTTSLDWHALDTQQYRSPCIAGWLQWKMKGDDRSNIQPHCDWTLTLCYLQYPFGLAEIRCFTLTSVYISVSSFAFVAIGTVMNSLKLDRFPTILDLWYGFSRRPVETSIFLYLFFGRRRGWTPAIDRSSSMSLHMVRNQT